MMNPQPGDLVKVHLTREGIWTGDGIQVNGHTIAVPPEAQVAVVKRRNLHEGQMWLHRDTGELYVAARYDSYDPDKLDLYGLDDSGAYISADEFDPTEFELLFDPRWRRQRSVNNKRLMYDTDIFEQG